MPKKVRASKKVRAVMTEDRRFKQYLVIGMSVFFLVSSIVPFLHVEEKSREELEKLPPQLTEFILKKKTEQKKVAPKPIIKQEPKLAEPKKVAQKKPTPKPVEKIAEKRVEKKAPIKIAQQKESKTVSQKKTKKQRIIKATQAERATARVQASQSGVLAMQAGLAQLTSRNVQTKSAKTIGRVSDRGAPQVNTAMAAVSQGNSGASAATQIRGDEIVAVVADHATEALAKADSGAVLADVMGNQLTRTTATTTKPNAPGVRDESGIRKIFEKNKSAIYLIYARAQRKNEDLAGKLVLEINITPEGTVAGVSLIESDLNDKKLVKKIMTRVRMFKFGEQNVSVLKMRYTFEFVAA